MGYDPPWRDEDLTFDEQEEGSVPNVLLIMGLYRIYEYKTHVEISREDWNCIKKQLSNLVVKNSTGI